MQLHLDRAAQALEIVAAADDALAALETRLAQRATAAGDALGDVLMVLGMGENGDIAVPEADQMDARLHSRLVSQSARTVSKPGASAPRSSSTVGGSRT